MTRTDDDAMIEVGDALPDITWVEARERHTVSVAFRGGEPMDVDLAPDLFAFRHYAPLRDDRALFESLRVVDGGNAIAWGDGSIVMPATAIERLSA